MIRRTEISSRLCRAGSAVVNLLRGGTMAKEPEFLAHQEWLGYVQPVGLVVSIPALLAAGAHINRNIAPDHQRFLSALPRDKKDEIIPEIRDFPAFATTALGWEKRDLVGGAEG